MTCSPFDPAAQGPAFWSFGAKIGPKRLFKHKQLWAIRFLVDRQGRVRERTLFDVAYTIIAGLYSSTVEILSECDTTIWPSILRRRSQEWRA